MDDNAPRTVTGGTAPTPGDGMWDTYGGRILGAVAVITLAIGTVAYRVLEDWGWIDALYFSVVTLTSVGFGDLVPTTGASKLFTVFYIIGGISIIGAFLDQRLRRRGRRVRAGRR